MISVTQVLSAYWNADDIPEDRLAAAIERGNAVHAVCSSYAQGLFALKPPAYAGYVESFIRWFDNVVDKVIFVEKRFSCPLYNFNGKPDLGIVIKGDTDACVVDIKTPIAYRKAWAGQLVAYRYLANEYYSEKASSGRQKSYHFNRVFSLRLDADGKAPRINEVTDPDQYFKAFLHARFAHQFFMEG